MKSQEHGKVTGFSGNEIYCLNKIGCQPGQLCLGNNVISISIGKTIGAGLSNLAGGEIEEVTQLVHDGRKNAYNRMMDEAKNYGGIGLAGVSFDMMNHPGCLEFIAIGSTVRKANKNETMSFSTSDDAQALYCQLDCGFMPRSFVFGNVAYSIGVGGSFKGLLRSFKRGEIKEYTEIFDHTRHLSLTRIKQEAKEAKANAVIGIKTSIIPLMGTQEMMMLGTASTHPALEEYYDDPVTCDLTNVELWNMVNMGYLPISLVMGVSVYSIGFIGSIKSGFKSFFGGTINTATELLYEAREKALERVQRDAEKCGADEVIGVKTYIYDLGGGLVEFMAIGTAVKKMEGVNTRTPTLPTQAIIQDTDTFVNNAIGGETKISQSNSSSATATQKGAMSILLLIITGIYYMTLGFLGK